MIKKNNSSFIFGTVSMLAAGTYYVNDSASIGLNQNANQSSLNKQANNQVKKPKSLIDSLSSSFLGQKREVTFSEWLNTPEAISQYEKWRNSQDGIKNLGVDFVKTPQYKTGLHRWAGNTKRPFKDFYKVAKKQTKYQQAYNNWKVGSSGRSHLKQHYVDSATFSKEADDWIKNGPGAINAKTFFDMKNREAEYRKDYDTWRAKAANLAALETSWKKTKDYTDKKQAWLNLKNQKGEKPNWLSSSYVNSYYQNWKASPEYQKDVEKDWKTTTDYTQKRDAWINVYPTKKTITQYKNDESLWINKFNQYKDSAAGNLEIENEIKKLNAYTSRKNTWSPQGKNAWINSEAVNNYYNTWRVSTAGRNALKPIWEATNDYTTKKEDWIKSSFTDKKGKDEWLQSVHSTPFYNAWKVTPGAQTLLKNEWMRNVDGDYGRKKDAWIAANYTKRNKAYWSSTNDANTKYNTWLASTGSDALLKTNWETTSDYTTKKEDWIENNKIKRSKNVWLGLDAAKASYNAWRVTSGGRNVLKPLYEASGDYTTNRNNWLLDPTKFTTKTPKNQWFNQDPTHAWTKYNNWKVTDAAKTVVSSEFHKQQSYKNALNTWLSSTWGGKRDKDGWALTSDADNAFSSWKNKRSKTEIKDEEGDRWRSYGKTDYDAAFGRWPGITRGILSLKNWSQSSGGKTVFENWTKSNFTHGDYAAMEKFWNKHYYEEAKKKWVTENYKEIKKYTPENINRWKSITSNLTGYGNLKDWKPKKNSDFQKFPEPMDLESKFKYKDSGDELENIKYYGPAYNKWNLNETTKYYGPKTYSYKFGHYLASLKHWKANNRQILKDHWSNNYQNKTFKTKTGKEVLFWKDWVNKNFNNLRKSDWVKSGQALGKYNQWKASTQGQEALKNYYKTTDKYEENLQKWVRENNKRKARDQWNTSNHAKSSYETWKESDEGKRLLKTQWETQPDYTTKKGAWVTKGTHKRSFETWIQDQASTSAYDTWEQVESNKDSLKTAWKETNSGDNNFKDSVNDWFNTSSSTGNYDTKEERINHKESDEYLLNFLKNDENKALIDQFEASDFYKNPKKDSVLLSWLKSDYSPVENWVLNSLMSDQNVAAKSYRWRYSTYVKRRASAFVGYGPDEDEHQSYWQKILTNHRGFRTNDTTTLKTLLYEFIKEYVNANIFSFEKQYEDGSQDAVGRNIQYDANDGAGKSNLRFLHNNKNNESRLKEFWKKKIFKNNDNTNVGMLPEVKNYLAYLFLHNNNLDFEQDNTYQASYKKFLNSKSFYLQKFKHWLNQNQDNAKVAEITNDIYYQYKKKEFEKTNKFTEKFDLWLANKNNGKNIYKDSSDAKSEYANWNDTNPIVATRSNYDSNYKYNSDYESWINNAGASIGLSFYLRQTQANTDYNSWVDSANLLEYNNSQFNTDFSSWESDKSTKSLGNGFDFYLKNTASNSAFNAWYYQKGKEAYKNSPSFWKDFHNHYYADTFTLHAFKQQISPQYSGTDKSQINKLGYFRINKLTLNSNGQDVFLSKEEYAEPYYKGWYDVTGNDEYDREDATDSRGRTHAEKDFDKWVESSPGVRNKSNLKRYWDEYLSRDGTTYRLYRQKYLSTNPGKAIKEHSTYKKTNHYYNALKSWLNKNGANGKSNWFWFYINDWRRHYLSAYNNWNDPNGEVEYRKTDAYKNSLKAFCEANINNANDPRVQAYLTTTKSTTDYNTWIDLSGENSYKASTDYTNHLDAWSANNNDAFTEFSGSHSQTYYNSWNDPNPLKYTANDYKTRGTYQNDFTSWRNALATNRKSNGFNYYLTQGQSNTDYAAWIDPQGEIEYKSSGAQYTRDFNDWETKAKGIGVYGATGKSTTDYNGWIDPGGESPYKNTNQYLVDLDRWSSTKSNGLSTYASSTQSGATWATKLDAEFAKTTISQNLINSLKPTHNKNIYQNSRQFQSDYNLWEDPLLRTENKYLLTQNFKDSASAYYDSETKKFNLYKTTDTSEKDYLAWRKVTYNENDYLSDAKKTQDLNAWSSIFNNGRELYAQSKKPQDDIKAYNQERKRTSEKYKNSKTFADNYVKFINTTGQTYFDTWFHTAGFGKVLYSKWKDTKGVDPDDTTYMGTQAYVDDLSVWSKNIVNGRNAFEKSTLAKSLFAQYKNKQEQ